MQKFATDNKYYRVLPTHSVSLLVIHVMKCTRLPSPCVTSYECKLCDGVDTGCVYALQFKLIWWLSNLENYRHATNRVADTTMYITCMCKYTHHADLDM